MTALPPRLPRRAAARLQGEEGFTMLFLVGVLAVVMLLLGAGFVAVSATGVSQHDIDAKRAYYAARAAEAAYLSQLNQNPDYWKTCANDTQSTPVSLPGSTTGESYEYFAVPANGYATCTSDPISSMIDSGTGTLRIKFVGLSGNPQVSRTIVAGFRRDSPIDYLWYSVYEALDASISGYSGCNAFYWQRSSTQHSLCDIYWVTGDAINGPMYSQDQYLVSGSPTFGRNANDKIKSVASAVCANNDCGSATVNATMVPNAPTVSAPPDNGQLYTDATNHGKVYTGTTTITLGSPDGTHATVKNCPSSCTTTVVDLTQYPIIYVSNGNGCPPYGYSPFSVSYATSGCVGDAYVSGNYTTSVTIAAANNIIVSGNITTTESSGKPTGTATAGLIANYFVRVMHGVNGRNPYYGGCNGATDVGSQTLPNPTKIDAAILTLQHSFIVDNFDCGGSLGQLAVNGAIAQYYRGAVGTGGGTGYLKSYTYDDRLAYLLPPYLFDLATSGWHINRETLCTSSNGC